MLDERTNRRTRWSFKKNGSHYTKWNQSCAAILPMDSEDESMHPLGG